MTLHCDKCRGHIGNIEKGKVVLFGFNENFEKWRRPLIECPKCKKISKPGTSVEIEKRKAKLESYRGEGE